MARLELRHLIKAYGDTPVVKDVSLAVGDGELICLLGPSGCGKTTTLRMIGGFVAPDSGEILVDGEGVTRLAPEHRPTAMVFQRYTLWPHMDVWHNVAFGLQIGRRPRAEIDRAVRGALDLVGLPDFGRRNPAQLSGGQQQRVALARALVLEPRILLLDEPLSNLDAQLRVRMREEITAIQRRIGITTVFVTHDQEEALSIADRIGVMHNGVLEQLDSPGELYARPSTLFVATFIGTMNLLEARRDGPDRLVAGPFRLPAPADADGPAAGRLVVGLRPEEIDLNGPGGAGIPARVTQVTDLGHYRRATVSVEGGGTLTVFAAKGREIPLGPATVWPRRALVYADERLVGALDRVPSPSVV
jgi:putative spermidine/putrescine transport system ATP-binding protein